MEAKDKISKLRKIYYDLEAEFKSYRARCKEICEYLLPEYGLYLTTNEGRKNDASNKYDKIINGTAEHAINIAASFMQEGLTSPTKPWFRLTLADTDLLKYDPVKEWLYFVTQGMLNIFARSNYYGSNYSNLMELLAFGTSSNLISSDFDTVIRCRSFTIGEYYLSLDASLRPKILYRHFKMKTRQIIERFGYDNCSNIIQTAFNGNNKENEFEIINVIQPKDEIILGKLDKTGMDYESLYFEKAGHIDNFLLEEGYRECPFSATRWHVKGIDTYGSGRGTVALGDIKMLQKMEEKKLKALDKTVDPPMNAPTSMKGKALSIIPGGVTYIDTLQGQQGFSPTYQINPDTQNIGIEIKNVEDRINKFFFKDLILAILASDKNMTATEIAHRHSEKVSVLGAVIEKIQSEKLDPDIKRTFSIMNDFGLIPPIPEEMQGQNIKIEYISLLAQAQKMIGITGIEQTAGFIGNIARFIPEAVDKFDYDEAIDEYSDIIGISPKIIRSDDEVINIRNLRAQQIEAQRQMELAQSLTQGAKTMSDTKTEGNNMLTQILAGL